MERREHKRRRFWLPVTVDQLHESFAISHDASDSGLLLVCNRELSVGVPVSMRFCIPPGGSLEISVSGKVVRVAPNDEDPEGIWPYKVAVQFDHPVTQLEEYLSQLDSPVA
jgi:hypothetical protein